MVTTQVALLLGSFLCSFFFASLTVVVCVDCVARGATAGQSVWCYVGIPGAKDDQAPTPLFGEPLFISRVVGVLVRAERSLRTTRRRGGAAAVTARRRRRDADARRRFAWRRRRHADARRRFAWRRRRDADTRRRFAWRRRRDAAAQVYVAQLACYGVGFVIGSGIGMALALNVSLASCAATGSGLYALAGVVGIAVLPETLDAFSGLEPLGLASQSPSALCAVLWGGKADVERRSYVASYLFNAAAISCTPPLMVYFLLWRFDLNHIIYFELVASVAAALIVGFLSYARPSGNDPPWLCDVLREDGAGIRRRKNQRRRCLSRQTTSSRRYWFYLRERFGGCRCMFWGLGVLAIGFAGVGVAFELKMLFAALPLCVLTSPTLLQYLFIHGAPAARTTLRADRFQGISSDVAG